MGDHKCPVCGEDFDGPESGCALPMYEGRVVWASKVYFPVCDACDTKNPPPAEYPDIMGCLDCARAAIVEAICSEDGLDGGAGEVVVKWITDLLGDQDTWRAYQTTPEGGEHG